LPGRGSRNRCIIENNKNIKVNERKNGVMKTEWDYTDLAEAYLKRPDYAQTSIDKMLETAGVKKGDAACDVGAGAAHLTLKLAEYGLNVCAVEPNDAMRKNGIQRTSQYQNVQWFEGVGEHTGMESNKFDLVTFGSSFNVCNRQEALLETKRILKSNGWFACMWNHRDLNDPLQMEIEDILKTQIDDYKYGTRREDQTEVIDQSGLFKDVICIEGTVVHEMSSEDFVEGWKSHGTVQRQSKDKFAFINEEIRKVVEAKGEKYIKVPYTTRIWMAQVK
jgi:ubiquinone/menaquinone biosynthesis C-methylase UbiE